MLAKIELESPELSFLMSFSVINGRGTSGAQFLFFEMFSFLYHSVSLTQSITLLKCENLIEMVIPCTIYVYHPILSVLCVQTNKSLWYSTNTIFLKVKNTL